MTWIKNITTPTLVTSHEPKVLKESSICVSAKLARPSFPISNETTASSNPFPLSFSRAWKLQVVSLVLIFLESHLWSDNGFWLSTYFSFISLNEVIVHLLCDTWVNLRAFVTFVYCFKVNPWPKILAVPHLWRRNFNLLEQLQTDSQTNRGHRLPLP